MNLGKRQARNQHLEILGNRHGKKRLDLVGVVGLQREQTLGGLQREQKLKGLQRDELSGGLNRDRWQPVTYSFFLKACFIKRYL